MYNARITLQLPNACTITYSIRSIRYENAQRLSRAASNVTTKYKHLYVVAVVRRIPQKPQAHKCTCNCCWPATERSNEHNTHGRKSACKTRRAHIRRAYCFARTSSTRAVDGMSATIISHEIRVCLYACLFFGELYVCVCVCVWMHSFVLYSAN